MHYYRPDSEHLYSPFDIPYSVKREASTVLAKSDTHGLTRLP